VNAADVPPGSEAPGTPRDEFGRPAPVAATPAPPAKADGGGGFGRILAFTVGAVLAACAAIFAVYNQGQIAVRFLDGQAVMPLWVVMVVSAAVGFVLALLFLGARRVSKRAQRRKKRR
jgi:uncharacterized integral membrane protein